MIMAVILSMIILWLFYGDIRASVIAEALDAEREKRLALLEAEIKHVKEGHEAENNKIRQVCQSIC